MQTTRDKMIENDEIVSSFQNLVLSFKPISPASYRDNPFGLPGSFSIFCRSHLTCTSTVRLSPMKSQPQTRSRTNSRESICPLCSAKKTSRFILLRFEGQGFVMESHFATGDVDHKVPKFQFLLLVSVSFDLSSSSRSRRERRICALTRAINSRMENGLVR